LSTTIVIDPEQIERETQEAAAAAEAANAKAPETEPASQAPAVDDLPEKYRGKSVQEIVEMHRNAESELGRKNNEIGMIRKLADELIGVRAAERQAAQENQPKAKPLTADALLDSPEEAILGVVKREALSKTQQLEAKISGLEERLMVEDFEKLHPGFQQTMASPDFGGWLQSSEYRKKLGFRAAQGDFEAADELFGLYEEYNGAKAQAPQPEPPKARTTAREATLARSGGSAAGGVVPSADGKKVWTRAELMDMRINRPEEFDMRQDEILSAYREKRVR